MLKERATYYYIEQNKNCAVSMLQAAGTGVCVANAREDVKTQVNVFCPSNQEDGVADYIEKYVFREERP